MVGGRSGSCNLSCREAGFEVWLSLDVAPLWVLSLGADSECGCSCWGLGLFPALGVTGVARARCFGVGSCGFLLSALLGVLPFGSLGFVAFLVRLLCAVPWGCGLGLCWPFAAAFGVWLAGALVILLPCVRKHFVGSGRDGYCPVFWGRVFWYYPSLRGEILFRQAAPDFAGQVLPCEII